MAKPKGGPDALPKKDTKKCGGSRRVSGGGRQPRPAILCPQRCPVGAKPSRGLARGRR